MKKNIKLIKGKSNVPLSCEKQRSAIIFLQIAKPQCKMLNLIYWYFEQIETYIKIFKDINLLN